MIRKEVLFLLGIFLFIIIARYPLQIFHPPLAKLTRTDKIQSGMKITSSAFENNGHIPSLYTCSEKGINPSLVFSDIPENTKSLALIMDDPDAPIGTFVHWVVFNIPPTTVTVEENSKITGGTEGVNGTGKPGYIGPCPPSGTHRYFFKLYALDKNLSLEQTANKEALEQAMKEHIISVAELVGLYSKGK